MHQRSTSPEYTGNVECEIARRMLGFSMTLILMPNVPYRDEILAMYTEEDGTPQAEFRRVLCKFAGLDDQKTLEATEPDLNVAFEIENKKGSGFFALPPRLKSDEAYQKRHQSFCDWLFDQVINVGRFEHLAHGQSSDQQSLDRYQGKVGT